MHRTKSKQFLALLLLANCLLMLQFAHAYTNANANVNDHPDLLEEDAANIQHVRSKRGIIWDFFQKMVITKNLLVDQYTDTRNTLNDIYNTVNEQFSDPAPAKPTNQPRITTEKTPSSGEDPTTTTESYSISRYELGRILGRNFRGIQRLAQTELQQSLNATKYNLQRYKAEADQQFANSLVVEKKNTLKSLKG